LPHGHRGQLEQPSTESHAENHEGGRRERELAGMSVKFNEREERPGSLSRGKKDFAQAGKGGPLEGGEAT